MNSVWLTGEVVTAVESRLFDGRVLKDVFWLQRGSLAVAVSRERAEGAPALRLEVGDWVEVRGELAVVNWQGPDTTGRTRPEILANSVTVLRGVPSGGHG